MSRLERRASSGIRWPHPGNGPWLVNVHFAIVDGVAECVGLDVRLFRDDGSTLTDEVVPLTATVIRSLPVGEIIDQARRTQEVIHGDAEFLTEALEGHEEAVAAARKDARAYRRRGGRRIEWTPERLNRVAAVYLTAIDAGRPPTRAVADAFVISHSMATKVVGRCRREGLLPRTTKGKASGRPRDEQESE